MVEFLFGLGVYIATVAAVSAAVQAIPSVAAMFSVVTGQSQTIIGAIESFGVLLDTYVQPWISLLNIILPASVKSALVALIVWRLVRPLGLSLIETTTGATRSIIEKLL